MKFLPLWVLWGAFCLAPAVQAERADRDKPMQVEADRMHHDENRQVTTLTGQVRAVKGTLVLRGERMVVTQDAEGYQNAQVWAAPGQRVYFRQKREAVQEHVEGESEEALYDGRTDVVTLIRRAEARILREGAAGDQLRGERIVYNNTSEVLSVDGRELPGAGRSRVSAVLAPRSAASAPAAPAASGPALRPQPSLQPSVQERRP